MKIDRQTLKRLASVRLTLICLGLMMVLVFIGTIAQVQMGTFSAQKAYFNSFVVYTHSLGHGRIPIFPGGLTIGALWFANLVAAFFFHFKWERKSIGLLISHFGLILLLLGQFLTQRLSKESSMPIEIGQTANFSESPQEVELAVIKTSAPKFDEVTSIPPSLFDHENVLSPAGIPFSIIVKAFYANARLSMAGPEMPPIATKGIGSRVAAVEAPLSSSDDEPNAATALVEIKDGAKSLGTWLLSSGLGAPQSVSVQGEDYSVSIRPRRTYYPFALTLTEFHHDIYPGTDIPKNFSSHVRLNYPDKHDSRDALIFMNHPLRYEGKTFYQASFGNNDRLSVLQVVDNPAAVTPYISCGLVILGLAIQFLMHLTAFIRKRA